MLTTGGKGGKKCVMKRKECTKRCERRAVFIQYGIAHVPADTL
jgi:hypothetical protein